MADAFFYRSNGLFYDVVNARTGEVVMELIDCVAEARNYVEEHTARAIELEAAEVEAETFDALYRQVSYRYDADASPYTLRNSAVRVILRAMDALGRPVGMRVAA